MQAKYSNEKVIEVLKDCFDNNLTATEASKKHGMSPASVINWAERAGIKLKKGEVKQYDWALIKESLAH